MGDAGWDSRPSFDSSVSRTESPRRRSTTAIPSPRRTGNASPMRSSRRESVGAVGASRMSDSVRGSLSLQPRQLAGPGMPAGDTGSSLPEVDDAMTWDEVANLHDLTIDELINTKLTLKKAEPRGNQDLMKQHIKLLRICCKHLAAEHAAAEERGDDLSTQLAQEQSNAQAEKEARMALEVEAGEMRVEHAKHDSAALEHQKQIVELEEKVWNAKEAARDQMSSLESQNLEQGAQLSAETKKVEDLAELLKKANEYNKNMQEQQIQLRTELEETNTKLQEATSKLSMQVRRPFGPCLVRWACPSPGTLFTALPGSWDQNRRATGIHFFRR
ncbi:hypothetical protein CYMTET_49564 [Cymbomonas tetramitiformis]|uniref:Uncharacterized protein n=1 Tax=Cymbomonas tetramitiformis TaxID=36881 RepID=A0AAE0BR29_9CHLO|nr:hypothetical protein CYMTET_49564 [Cymbomonas tetramitiformis]